MSGRSGRRAALVAGWALLGAAVTAALLPAAASAHGLVGRKDLPIPAWLFAWGASIVLIVSFVALCARLAASPRFEDDDWRPLGAGLVAGAASAARRRSLCGAIGVLPARRRRLRGPARHRGARPQLLAHLRLRHRSGSASVVLSVLLGDVFRAFNPWRAIGRAVGGGFSALVGQKQRRRRFATRSGSAAGPRSLGLLGFVWLELVYGAERRSRPSG